MNDRALLKFQIGPVQTFIEAARTVRDLWTGSYLLSWLVVAALRKAKADGAEILSPCVDGNPILELYRDTSVLTACLPNHFEAEAPGDRAQSIAEGCENACREEWLKITDAVLQRLKERLDSLGTGWDRDWKQQVESFFEIRCVVLPASGDSPGSRMEQLHLLMDTSRSIKHTPNYVPHSDGNGRFGMKCSVLGMFEQVGPAGINEARGFWDSLAGQGFDGTKLRERERFCAVSLVKRFAWPAYLANAVGFGQRKNELRYSDTATVGARIWLNEAGINPNDMFRHEGWSGQWLHSAKDEEDRGDEKCPEAVRKIIGQRKAELKKPIPPYYGVLMIDGDHVGALLRREGQNPNSSTYVPITNRLSQFALKKVKPIVEDNHFGELIYAGGDDVLAVTPTATALACAKSLVDSYRSKEIMGDYDKATMSAGIVIAHYKEDLRFVLEEARKAERAAKNAGRDRLALRILRRSGEHTLVVLPWTVIPEFQKLVDEYIGTNQSPPSDRWSYKLRADLPVVEQSLEMFTGEMARLLNRLEMPIDKREAFRVLVLNLFEKFKRDRHELSTEKVFGDFVTICQSASFLSRGGTNEASRTAH